MPSLAEQSMLKVSVIIPTYNRAIYLQEALESIFQQTLAPAEVIVVDDGSTDHTEDIVQHARKPVQFTRQQHQGIVAARNLGLQKATGDLIAWLDADDLWEPNFLATVVPLLEADNNVDGVYTGFIHIDDAGNILPQVSSRVVPPADLYQALAKDCFLVTPTVIVRKRCFERIGTFDPQFEICEDYDMWLRLAKEFTILGLPSPLARIRVHQDNTIRNTEAFCRFRLALTQKHFHPPESEPEQWPVETRQAHAHAFRAVAIRYIQADDPDQAWRYLEQAASIWPPVLCDLTTYYELACGDQPRGYRGRADGLNIETGAAELLDRLDALFAKSGPAVRSLSRAAYGNAYLALAMLSDQARQWSLARDYMFQAIRTNPHLLASYSVIRRLTKLSAGSRLVGLARKILGTSTTEQQKEIRHEI